MINLSSIKNKIKSRLGELWWYTIVIFVAQQAGSLINAVIGLWLVPKYVPQNELGAVLPLASVGSLIGLPLTILMTPFLKFLTKYMAQGEIGKVKALLRDVLILTGITFVLVSGLAYLFMPLIFKRMRVENGLLSILIVGSGIVVALAPVFSTALQALKKFRMTSMLGFAGAIIRLVTLLIALPIRGLSGYFVGQLAPVIFGIIVSIFALRKYMGKAVNVVSYWSEDWKPILKFTAWNAILNFVSQLMGTTEGFVVRHRLSDVESAAFYMISRFAEISLYISMASSVVLFPLISESYEKGIKQEQRLLTQSFVVSFAAGLLFAVAIIPIAHYIFMLKSDWTVYASFIPHLFMLSIIHVIRGSTYCFIIYKMAKNEFSFVPYCVCVSMSEVIILYCLTGYAFFVPWLPLSWIQELEVFNPCRLSVVLWIILLHNVAMLIYVIVAIVKSNLRNRTCTVGVNQHT